MRGCGGTGRIGLAPGGDPSSRRPGRPGEAPEGRGRRWMGPGPRSLRPCAAPGRLLQVRPLSSREPGRVGIPRAEGRHLSGAARAGDLVRPPRGASEGPKALGVVRTLGSSLPAFSGPRFRSLGGDAAPGALSGGSGTCPLCRPHLADAPSMVPDSERCWRGLPLTHLL